jgi:hypothetical protein
MMHILAKTTLAASILIGIVACTKTWDYNPADIPSDFVPLPKPAAGEGYQLHVPAFPVPPHFEREWFMRVPVGNTEEVYMTGYEVRQRENSHHVIAYQFADELAPDLPKIGEMRDQNGPDGRLNFYSRLYEDVNLLAEAASPYQKVELPEGFAFPIAANATLDLNSHYFNKTDKTIFGEVTMNIYTKPKSAVQHILREASVDNGNEILLPPKQTTTIEYSEIFEEDRRLKVMFSHMHKRGKMFEVFKVGGTNDGQKIFETDDWHDPKFTNIDDEILVRKGEGLRTRITYENESDRTIRFGVTSEDEMGIFFFFYY